MGICGCGLHHSTRGEKLPALLVTIAVLSPCLAWDSHSDMWPRTKGRNATSPRSGFKSWTLTSPTQPYPLLFLPYTVSPLVAQTVKRLPAMQETWVRSLGRKDPLEKEMATHSSTLGWKIPWTEASMGSPRVRHDWATSLTYSTLPSPFLTPHCILDLSRLRLVWVLGFYAFLL